MRILHVIPTLDPATGGPPKIAIRIAAAQSAAGHDVHMLAYRTPGTEQTVADELKSVPHADGIKVKFVDAQGRLERFTAATATREVESLLHTGVDFLHLHSLWSAITKASASVARTVGVPYTLLINGMLDPWSLSQRSLKKKIALALGYRKMLNGCTFLHLGNRDEQRLIEPLGLTCATEIIPNGIFEDEISPLPLAGTFRKKFTALNDAPYVLFLGRLHFKKGLDYLADAVAQVVRVIPDAQLVVAGPDDGERMPFEKRIARLAIGKQVHLVGSLHGQDKLAALNEAAVFCLPSRQEGFSVAITEALGCGVPVVVSEACHFPEVAEVNAGFVTPLDASAVAAALIRVLQTPDARKTFGERGRKLVLDRFTWPRVAQQTVDAYTRYSRVKTLGKGN